MQGIMRDSSFGASPSKRRWMSEGFLSTAYPGLDLYDIGARTMDNVSLHVLPRIMRGSSFRGEANTNIPLILAIIRWVVARPSGAAAGAGIMQDGPGIMQDTRGWG